MAGRVRQSQVPAGDRPRAAACTVGDARRTARRPDGQQRPPPLRLVSRNRPRKSSHAPPALPGREGATVIPQLTKPPSVDVGMLVRRPPHEAFEALADPSITTRFWFTKSTGRMAQGAELTWEWEMYRASGRVWVKEIQADRRIRF